MNIIWILLCSIFIINSDQVTNSEIQEISPIFESFVELLSDQSNFVDKTLFIEEFFKQPGNYCSLSCPRKFGKSSLLSMLKFFVQMEINEADGTKINKPETRSYKYFTDSFLGLQMSQFKQTIKEHLAEYPVIYISFKGIVKATFEESLRALKDTVRNSFQMYDWLHDLLRRKNSSRCHFRVLDRVKNDSLVESNLTSCFYELSELLFCFFGKRVFVFIDDHDAALNEAFENEFDFDIKQLHELIISMTSELLQPKSEYFVAFAFITSITQTTTNRDDYSGTINHFRFLKSEALAPFCGFTDDEVNTLISHNKQINITQRNILRRFYNGYGVTPLFLGIYNPYTIKQYLSMDKDADISSIRQMNAMDFLTKFFKNTLLYKVVLHLTLSKSDNIYSQVQWFNVNKMVSLIEDVRRLEPPGDRNIDVFFWYFLENGYFTYCEKPPVHFRVPNEGIRREIMEYLFEFYDQELASGILPCADIVKEIFQGEIQDDTLFKKFKKFLDSFVSKMTHFFHQSTNKEYHYQAVLYYWIKKSFAGTSTDVSISLHDKDSSSNVITVDNDGTFLLIQLKCKNKFKEVLKQVQNHNSSLGTRHPKEIHYLAINYKRNFTEVAYCNLTEKSSIFIEDYSIQKTTSSITWITRYRKKVSKNRLPYVKYNLGPIEWD